MAAFVTDGTVRPCAGWMHLFDILYLDILAPLSMKDLPNADSNDADMQKKELFKRSRRQFLVKPCLNFQREVSSAVVH